MKILVGLFNNEANSFVTGVSDEKVFKSQCYIEGQAVLDVDSMYIGGFGKKAEEYGSVELIPSIITYNAGAVVEREFYDTQKNKIVKKINECKNELDGICLALHGAGIVEGILDFEFDLLCAIREVVGYKMPISVVSDLHGNISQNMLIETDILVSCKEYPHSDMVEVGERAMELLIRTIKGEIKPVTKIKQIPLLISLPAASTLNGPAKEINEYISKRIREYGHNLLDVSFFHGFPYGDTPDTGASVVVVTNRDEVLADHVAEDIAKKVWSIKEQFFIQYCTSSEAIDKAILVDGKPVIINETSDNPGCGSPGDGTRLLKEMLDRNIEKSCFGVIADSEVVEAAHKAGIGSKINIKLGAKTDNYHGEPLEIKDAYVKCNTDGLIKLTGPVGTGMQFDLGKSTRLAIGNVDVIVTSVRYQTFDNTIFMLHGINIMDYRIVGLKSTTHFRGYFSTVAKKIITADDKGSTSSNFLLFDYKNLQCAMYPIDKNVKFGNKH